MEALLNTEEARCNDIIASEQARQQSDAAAMLGVGALHSGLVWPLQMRAELSRLQRRRSAMQVRSTRWPVSDAAGCSVSPPKL